MASLPARQPSQRRSSPEQNSSTNQAQPPTPQSPIRARSEDSQTLFLASPSEAEDNKPADQTQESAELPKSLSRTDTQGTDPGAKKCWICFSDSTEDTPETSPWRDPCPCALVAHEECLLDWIADMEAPNSRRSRNASTFSGPKIECPQCKSEIKLARPRNLIVEGVRGLERLGGQLIWPTGLLAVSDLLYQYSMSAGVGSIYAIFGNDDGWRILRPMLVQRVAPPLEFQDMSLRRIGDQILGSAMNHLSHWRLYVGLPLIMPITVLSRTTLADSILPVLPILFFATQTHSRYDTIDFGQWPPSASLAFAVLPYLRSAYNLYYQKVWAEREKKWLKEIQPRAREGGADADAGGEQEEGQVNDDDENVFEVRIDGGIWEDWDDEDSEDEGDGARNHPPGPNNAPPPAAAPAPELQQPDQPPAQPDQDHANEAHPADPPPNIADNRPAQPPQLPNAPDQPPPHNHNHVHAAAERRLSFSPQNLASTILGAILFPTIAGLSGELLKLALPRSWTTSAPALYSRGGYASAGRTAGKGLLHEKWGRSLVGGCLFVALKDAVMLYARWRMVEMHRKRRVVDYVGEGKGTGRAGA